MTAPHPETTQLARPSLHLVPAPVSAPPYDDELPSAPVLRLVPTVHRAPRPLPVTPLTTPAQELDAWLAPERTPTSRLCRRPARTPGAWCRSWSRSSRGCGR